MESMRCKVFIHSLSHAYNNGVEIDFRPVMGGTEENLSFHAATPGGSFKVTLSKEASERLGAFTLGKEYYVDFCAAY